MRRLLLIVALAASAAAVWAPGTAAAAATSAPVLVVAVPDLRWSDVARMPALRELASRSAVGVLSVRSEGESTRCGDGLLELSAGTRVPSGVRACRLDTATLDRLRRHDRHTRYGAQVGTLGDRAGPAVAVGSAAATFLTDSRGDPVPVAASVHAAFAASPGAVVGVVDDALYTAADRAAASSAVDATIADQVAAAPPNAVVVVAGISDGPHGGPHLHPLLVHGAGFSHHELSSPTTGRAPYVQLFDLTATIADLRAATRLPSSVSGRPVRVSGGDVQPVASYVDIDRHARRALAVGHPTFSTLCGVLIGCLLLAAFGRRESRWAARLLVFAPVATVLVQLVPWWRWNVLGYVGALATVCIAGAVAVSVAGRRSGAAAAVVVGPIVTAAVLCADQLAGAPLQLSAPLGDNPLVAGRFHGMGNIDYGLAIASLLLAAAVVASMVTSRRRRTLLVAALVVIGLVVDGAPSLGDDIGGVLALVPAGALLVAAAAQVRVTARRVLVILLAAVVAAGTIAIADYARPADRQTHAGRFVGQVLHGGAWRVVHRKLDAVLSSFANPLVTLAVVVTVVAVQVLHRRRVVPVVVPPAGLAAVGLLAALGSLLNDSGIFVAAACCLVTAAPLMTAAAPAGPGDTGRL